MHPMSTEFPVERTAIVTGVGAPRGIGRVVARRLAEEGWSLALIDIDEFGVAAFKKELDAAGFENVVAIPTDISSAESVDAAFALIDKELPAVVGLVNLAGIPCPTALLDLSLEEWNRVLAVNVTGSFLMLKAAAQRMVTTGVGRIVNTSSITAFDGGGTFSKGAYAAAKAAVLGLSRGGARELGRFGITVNTVAPGPIDRHGRRHPGGACGSAPGHRRDRLVPAVSGGGLHLRRDLPGRWREVHALAWVYPIGTSTTRIKGH
jgi:NAD(P)-dependent dehydrogenase (short-subunit alcohol dehydrogenase family)